MEDAIQLRTDVNLSEGSGGLVRQLKNESLRPPRRVGPKPREQAGMHYRPWSKYLPLGSPQRAKNFQDYGPIMVQLFVPRVPLRGFGCPSVSRSFNELPQGTELSRRHHRLNSFRPGDRGAIAERPSGKNCGPAS